MLLVMLLPRNSQQVTMRSGLLRRKSPWGARARSSKNLGPARVPRVGVLLSAMTKQANLTQGLSGLIRRCKSSAQHSGRHFLDNNGSRKPLLQIKTISSWQSTGKSVVVSLVVKIPQVQS